MPLSSLQEMARAIARTHAEKSRDQHSYLNVPDFEPHGWVIDAVHQALMMSPQHRPAEEIGYEPPTSEWRQRCARLESADQRITLQWARRATGIGGIPVADHFEMVPVEVPPNWRAHAEPTLAERIAARELSRTYVQRRGTRDPSVTRVGSDGASLRYDEGFPLEERFADQVVAELVHGDLKVERIVLTPHRVSVEVGVDSVTEEEVAKTSAKVCAAFDKAHANAKSTFEGKLEELAEAAFWHFDKVTKEGIPVPMPPGETPTVRKPDQREAFKAEIRHVSRALRSLMAPAEPTTALCIDGRWWSMRGTWAAAPGDSMKLATCVLEVDGDRVNVLKDKTHGHYITKHVNEAPKTIRAVVEIDPGAPPGVLGTVISTGGGGGVGSSYSSASAAVNGGGGGGGGHTTQVVQRGVTVIGVALDDIRRGQRLRLHAPSGNVEPHDVDDVRLACEQAADAFAEQRTMENRRGTDRIFNAAGFSNAFRRLAGVTSPIDGNVVRAILRGRSDIVELEGGSHFRIREGS